VTTYRVIDLRTGEALLETSDRKKALAAVNRLQGEGRSWDDLDVIDVEKKTSLLLRSYESAARSFLAESKGQVYRSFRTLAEAKAAPIAAVIVEGDYGGQIFTTCPASLVGSTEERVRRLAEELETRTNATTYAGSAQVLFEPIPVGGGVAGGMGGGIVVNGVWVHEEIRQLGWAEDVEGILLGTIEQLRVPRPVVPREVREGVMRAYSERLDVFAHVFGFPFPDHLRTLKWDEWQRRMNAVVPPPQDYKRWYPSTLRAVLAEAQYDGGE
jgi:hypothetical protein